MPDPKPAEQYTPEGRTIVDETVFEDEATATEETQTEETPKDTPAKEETTEDPTEDETPEDTDPPEKDPGKEDDAEDPDKDKDTGKEDLIAGKFKTEDELKKAYQNLGGDPSKHKTTQALVEAYEYRQSEYTRIQQEQAERDRLAALIPDNKGKETVPNTKVKLEDLMAKVDWTKVSDAKTLGQELLTIMLEMMPKQQQQMPSPEELVETVIPLMKEREQKQEALSSIEVEVPRLKKDQGFRRAFAMHVVAGKKDGTKYPRTTEGLREAMKDFLSWAKSMSDEKFLQTETNARTKRAAIPGKETGEGMPGSQQGDEADDIISAYAEKNKRYNY